jgi:RND family efflux transporter MFP subunit
MQHRAGVVVLALAGLGLGGMGCGREAAGAAGRPAVAVEVAEVAPGEQVDAVDVVGSLAPKLAAKVKSEYSGTVAAVHVAEWVPVRKGQPLASLDVREADASVQALRAGLLQAQVSETRAVRELERAERLKEAGLLTRQGLEDARTAREAAGATTVAVTAQLSAALTRLDKAVIRAPFDGVVAARGVNVGDRVENMGGADPMFEVVDNRLLDLTMAVPSSRLGAVRAGQAVEFTVDVVPERRFRGRVTSVNPTVDPVSRAGPVVAQVHNADGALKGGLFARARILVGTPRDVLHVPRAALQGWDPDHGTADVYVVEGGVARRRPIRTGASSGGLVEVVSGVAAGERVATRGAFNLRDGDRVTASPAAGD